MVLEITQFELCRKIFEHNHLVQNPPSPLFQRCYRKFNPTLNSPIWATAFFQSLGKYAIWVEVGKYLNISIWYRIPPPLVPEMLSKIQSNPSSLGYGISFFIWSKKICKERVKSRWRKDTICTWKQSISFRQGKKAENVDFYFWRRDSRHLFVSDSWYCQIQPIRLNMFFESI